MTHQWWTRMFYFVFCVVLFNVRCFACNKKVGITGFECRCRYIFCGIHRYAEEHDWYADTYTYTCIKNNIITHITLQHYNDQQLLDDFYQITLIIVFCNNTMLFDAMIAAWYVFYCFHLIKVLTAFDRLFCFVIVVVCSPYDIKGFHKKKLTKENEQILASKLDRIDNA